MSQQYIVTGMTCAACQAHVEQAVSKLEGVESVTVSLLTNSMAVNGTVPSDKVIAVVEKAGYGAQIKGMEADNKSGTSASAKLAAEEDALRDRETPKLKKRLIRSVLWLLVLMYLTMGHNMLGLPVPAPLEHNHLGLALTQMIIAVIVMYINRDFFSSGFRGLVHLSPNMDALVALGSSVSFAWSLYVFYKMTVMITQGTPNMDLMSVYHEQLYFETAAMIPALITVGKTLESLSKGRTTDALKNLLRLAPKTAVVEREGKQIEVGIDEVRLGDIFVVKPGESIPVDGVIVEGSTAVDESALTGESIPVDKGTNDVVSAATINQSGFIKARATRVGEDTTFAQIIQMVSNAAATKAPIARIADKVSRVFVPAVMAIAAVVFIIWLAGGRTMTFALERAIAVLVVSCPCALGLATPVAIMAGNGMGAKNGILFKTAEALENTGHIQIVALDKTGTITEGKPVVTDVIPAEGVTETELLETAYALERMSEHPLAKAIVAIGERNGLIAREVTDFRALAGNGLEGRVDGVLVHGGSGKYIAGIVTPETDLRVKAEELAGQGKTPMFFALDGRLLGIIAVADVIKPDSARAVRELRGQGIEVVMLTGDNERTAKAIGKEAGVDRVIAGVMPAGKEAVICQLQTRGKVAMVGDGINDAPALTRADIGIAIGAGTDVAIDAADIVLIESRLTDVPGAIRLSRATLRNIHQNLFWAFAYNAVLIPMAAGLYPGIKMHPMWGAAAMALSSFTVCTNALRLNLFKVHDASGDRAMRRPAMTEQADASGTSCNVESIPIVGAGRDSGVGTCMIDDAISVVPMQGQTDAQNEGQNQTLQETVICVNGMMCSNCERHVKQAIEGIDGIAEAVPDHTTGKVLIRHGAPLDEEMIKTAITDADYEYAGVDRSKGLQETVICVEGMMCGNCERHVKQAIEGIDGIAEAIPDHTTGKVLIRHDAPLDEETVKAAVADAGYEYNGIV
ncbi:MAG: heavy metal translocating P-type ATPase [Clostridia bacterium]|nr:heavy metal translocating P-type ATPase [Clostridia bacterium]